MWPRPPMVVTFALCAYGLCIGDIALHGAVDAQEFVWNSIIAVLTAIAWDFGAFLAEKRKEKRDGEE